jgi:hypothetical protein
MRKGSRVTEPAPLARTEDLLVEEVDEDLLIYDVEGNEAHALNPPAAKVWRACDGTRGLSDLQAECGLTADAVALALDQLRERRLLVQSAEPGLSRRAVIGKAAVAAGAAGAAMPVIRSIVAPTPAMAQSGGGPGPTGATGATGATGPTGLAG